MIISVVNDSKVVSDDTLLGAVRAINRQIAEDVAPYWGLSATLRLDATGRGGTVRTVRGDALIRLRDDVSSFHATIDDGFPEGQVFTSIEQHIKATNTYLAWTVALSHEAIELLIDPNVNTLVRGPHPTAKRQVFYYREVCDPVQADVYQVDGINVANFVLPDYYSVGKKSPNTNFLGTPLKPFGWAKGGLVGFWDPLHGKHGAYVTAPALDKNDVRKKFALLKDKANAARILRYARPLRDAKRKR